MKKLFKLLVLILLVSCTNVYASENRLVIKGSGDELTYEKELINTDKLIVREHMLPGETYTDELIVENKSNKEFNLYFKLVPTTTTTELTELLNNIQIVVRRENVRVYEGSPLNATSAINSTNEKGAILIGKFTQNQVSTITITSTLSEDYPNRSNTSVSNVNCIFYTQHGTSGGGSGGGDDPGGGGSGGGGSGGGSGGGTTPSNPNTGEIVEIVPVPNTSITISRAVTTVSIIVLITGLTIMLYGIIMNNLKDEDL